MNPWLGTETDQSYGFLENERGPPSLRFFRSIDEPKSLASIGFTIALEVI